MPNVPARYVDLQAFREKARENDAPSDVALARGVKVHSVKAVGERQLAWVISTSDIDRENDIIDAKGWDSAGWVAAGAPVLWNHERWTPPYNVPIACGTAAPTLVEGSKLRSVADFGEPGVWPFADMVFALAKSGRLRGASVGFQPKEWSFDEDRGGVNFLKQELLEWSITPVPCNVGALQEARSAGIDLAPMREWAERVLDQIEPGGLWLPKARIEALLKGVLDTSVSVTVPANKLATALPGVTLPTIVHIDEAALQKMVDDKAAELRAEFTKAGRTFSKANEQRIRDAHESATKSATHLQECIDQIAADEASAEEPVEEAAAPVTEKAEPEPLPVAEVAPVAKTFSLYPGGPEIAPGLLSAANAA